MCTIWRKDQTILLVSTITTQKILIFSRRKKKLWEWRLMILSLFLEGKLEGTTRLLSLLRLVKIIKVSNSIYFYLIYVASSNYHRWFASWNLAEIHHQILRKNYHYAHCHHVTYFCFILASYWKQINYVSTSKWK